MARGGEGNAWWYVGRLKVGPNGCPMCTECGTALWSVAMLEAMAEQEHLELGLGLGLLARQGDN